MTTFSVIIPTRNRAALVRTALESVLFQTGADFEVVVVNDGTSGEEAAALDVVKAAHAGAATFIDLPATVGGHGCFRVMNMGVAHSQGDYLCFLDDDDIWTDPGHLADAERILAQDGLAVDAVFFDQAAYRGQTRATGPIWLEDLGARLLAAGGTDPACGYVVDPGLLLTAHGFAHTNITIIRRGMFEAIGGFDTTLWYEGDRDFFLRLIDAAAQLRYLPKICARHNIPDRAARASMSTATSDLDKALDQMRLLHKAAHHAAHAGLAAYARRHRRYALRKAVVAAVKHPLLVLKLVRFLPFLIATPARATGDVVARTSGLVPR